MEDNRIDIFAAFREKAKCKTCKSCKTINRGQVDCRKNKKVMDIPEFCGDYDKK